MSTDTPFYPNKPLEYTPQTPAPQPPPKSEYVLVNDVTGKPPVFRGVYRLVDGNGHEVKLPYQPKSNCNKCYGRGHLGMDSKTKKFLICAKCYPMVKGK